MDINTILTDIAQDIALNADLGAWSTVTYGRTHEVFINIDRRNPPGEDNCPYVVLYPISKNVGSGESVKRHGFEIICCVNDDSSRTHAETNVTEYEGVQNIETFRKKVETIIDGTDIGGAFVETVDIEYETIEMFPFMMAGMVVSIHEDWSFGDNPLD